MSSLVIYVTTLVLIPSLYTIYYLVKYNQQLVKKLAIQTAVLAHKEQQLSFQLEKLHANETCLTRTQRIARIGHWHLNIHTSMFYWSGETACHLGFPRAAIEVSMEYFLAVIAPEDRETVRHQIQEILYCDYPCCIEFRLSGEPVHYIQSYAKVVREPYGKPLYVLGITQDITERKQTELALIESEKRFREMADYAPVLIWVAGEDKLCNYFNKVWLSFTGRTIEQEIGNGWIRNVHPDDLQQCLQIYNDSFNQRQSFKMEYRLRRHDGIYRWVMDNGAPRFTEEGNFVGYIGSCTDITDSRNMTEVLKISQTTLKRTLSWQEAIFNNSSAGILVVTGSRVIAKINNKFSELLGYRTQELIGQSVEIIHTSRESFIKFGQEVYAKTAEHEVLNVEYQLKHKDGHAFWVDISGRAIDNKDLNKGVIWILIDITQRRQAQEALNYAKEAAETANRAKSAFLANMSHELRTPLNGILGYAQILSADKNLTQKQREGIHIIQRSGEYLLTLISDILDLSKIEAGRLTLYPTEFLFKEFLHSIVDLFHIRAQQKEITFTYEELSQLPTVVYADDKRLRQILINLLSNAIKFTRKGGVSLKVELNQHNRMRFTVEDTGVGIANEDLERIFQPFQQVGNEAYHAEGTGLGLPITKKLVEMMGGQLYVESILEQGSVFWTDLELQEMAFSDDIQKEELPSIIGYHGRKYKILVVDDKWENCAVLTNLLMPLGFELMEASNGQEGLKTAQQWQPDIVITDLLMPVMNGLDFVRQLRQQEQFKKTVIIAVSASVFEHHKEQSIAAGCDDFIPKPVRNQLLLQCLEQYLTLEWIYAAPTNSVGNTQPNKEDEIPVPKHEILEKLLQLTMMGDIYGLTSEIEQLTKESEQFQLFAEKINNLANHFKTKQLTELLKNYLISLQ